MTNGVLKQLQANRKVGLDMGKPNLTNARSKKERAVRLMSKRLRVSAICTLVVTVCSALLGTDIIKTPLGWEAVMFCVYFSVCLTALMQVSAFVAPTLKLNKVAGATIGSTNASSVTAVKVAMKISKIHPDKLSLSKFNSDKLSLNGS
jgi:hypothetical protein